jgi:transposase
LEKIFFDACIVNRIDCFIPTIAQKYKLNDILCDIFYVLKTGISWRMLRSKIHWNTVYKTYIKINSYGLFKTSYINLLKKYLVKHKNRLRYVFTDTSVVPNKYGEDKAKLNKFYKNKRVCKLSIITLDNGIPFCVNLYDGNRNDTRIFNEQFVNSNFLVNIDMNKTKYFMADKGYDSKSIKNTILNNGWGCLIPQNRRGIKNKNKLRKFTVKHKILYRQRMKVENMFNKIKTFRRLYARYDRKCSTFMGFVWLSLIFIILSMK